MRRLGIMPIWAREDFVLPALEQALDLVDILAITVHCPHEWLKKFEDSSEGLARGFQSACPDRILYLDLPPVEETAIEKTTPHILNTLLDLLHPENGDLIWMLQPYEFYSSSAQKELSEWVIEHSDFVTVRHKTRIFYPDFRHYVGNTAVRLHRYSRDRRFVPASYLSPWQATRSAALLPETISMFDYQLMCTWELLELMWAGEQERLSAKQLLKTEWATRILSKYDIEREELCMKENQSVTKHHGFWLDNSAEERTGGGLLDYDGLHPEYIEARELPARIVDSRKYFPFYRARLPLLSLKGKKKLKGIEIGVARAHHAWGILHDLDIEKLSLIDPYLEYSGDKASWKRQLSRLRDAVSLMHPWGDRVEFYFEKAEDAAHRFPSESQDFVYVDGSPLYEFVKKDLECYYPKLKPGGLMCGHDYHHPGLEGSTQAIDEFVSHHHLSLGTGGNYNFWFFKPEEEE